MNTIRLYAWSCDFKSNTGEGVLCQDFCKTFSREKKVFIKLLSPEISAEIFKSNIKVKKKIRITNLKLLHYIYPYLGVLYLWFQFFSGKKVMYLNYLPLWNFVILFLLPPKTLLGPITGGGQIQKNKKSNFIRKYLFPKFYQISLKILDIRQKKILFSTDLLKKFIKKKILDNFLFLFCLNIIDSYRKIKIKEKKEIDLLFYYNNHPHKFKPRILKLINKLANKNIKVCCVGERFPNKKIIYLGRIDRPKLQKIIKNSKLTFISAENYLSLYILDSIMLNLKIFVSVNEFSYLNHYFFKDNFLKYNSLSSDEKLIKYIISNLKKYKLNNSQKTFKNNVKKINKKNINYFSNLLIK